LLPKPAINFYTLFARMGWLPGIQFIWDKHLSPKFASTIMAMFWRARERLTVPATDFDDMKVFALNLDKPKSHTWPKMQDEFIYVTRHPVTFSKWKLHFSCYYTFIVQFLSTNKFGDLRSQCTIGGFRQWR
jgi:hypothetical protein